MISARYYTPNDYDQWDEFCKNSYNATVLQYRLFLSYHGNRFIDRSLVIERDGRWVGVLPAAEHSDDPSVVVSHPGITYGGVVHSGSLRGSDMIEAIASVCDRFKQSGYALFQYKLVPHIYHQAPAQDDLYAMYRLGGKRYRADLSCAVDLCYILPISDRRRRALKKAQKSSVTIETGLQYAESLWGVLQENLSRKHGVKPVHSVSEITLLANRFPENIQFVVAMLNGNVIAGVVLFCTATVSHAQYIASSEMGYEVNALDLVFHHCIDDTKRKCVRYFDFGISTEKQGSVLNDGLNRFKCEFGGGGVVHEFYEIDL